MQFKIIIFIVLFLISCDDSSEYDVIVIGGSAGGTSAAIQSSRNGAKTLLIEETDWLGGMLTSAGVSAVDGNYWENPYAMSKWINEQMAPPNSVGMRFTTVYGPDTRDNMMYGLLRDKKATYITNHKRDWIHVHDVCTAIRYLAPSTVTGPVSIGYGQSVPVRKLAERHNANRMRKER